MSDPANPTSAVENIGEEIVSDVKAFIQSAETTLTTDIEAAWSWLKSELAILAPEVLADLKAAVAAAAADAVTAGNAGSIVSDTLTALARNGEAVLAQVKTDVINAVVGLTTATPSK